MTGEAHLHHEETRAGWDLVGREKYRAEFDEHVALLRAGRHNLLEVEEKELGRLLRGRHVIHLQCSHGLDAIGLLNAGAASVLGIDISEEMITQAKAKASAVEVQDIEFIRCDVLDAPEALNGTADLIYTGRGSLPWILDLGRWAETIRRLLRPGGRVYVFEGHPLADLWDRSANRLEMRPGVSYFDETVREAKGFPAGVIRRLAGKGGPTMRERHWRPGQVIDSLLVEGLRLESFREHPTLFWDQFPLWLEELRRRLPNSYSILAKFPESPDEGPELAARS